MICETCGKEFFEDWRIDEKTRKKPCKFCSKGCSHKRIHSKETKEKIAVSMISFSKKKGTAREKKYCIKCGSKVSFNNSSGFCKNCKKPSRSGSENTSLWRQRKKDKLVEVKGGKCEICGYNRCIGALEFHHKDPKEKSFSISYKNIRSIEKYKKEIEKCILVCSNCHREIHSGIIELNDSVD